MLIGVPKETKEFEKRVAITPVVAEQLIKAGFSVNIEVGAGLSSYFSDDQYVAVGATLESDVNKLYANSDVIL
ncbi:MAG TPA: hypothetical protein PLD36_13960, partial [Bacteroidia bacterium]|nr:hypothetical protein [Bacteroidia bacterium]